MEILDVYDADHQKTGRTRPRGQRFAAGEYVLCGTAVLRDADRYLITQRHPQKSMGLRWEFPGGTVAAGETGLYTAVRELYEEVGVTITEQQVTPLGSVRIEQAQLIVDVYIAEKEIRLEELVLQQDEVVDARIALAEYIAALWRAETLSPVDWTIFCRMLHPEYEE